MKGGSGTAGRTTALGVAAVAVVVGFLFWLYQRSSTLEERVVPVMEDTTSSFEPTVATETFLQDPLSAIGERVGLEEVPVEARLGRGAFVLHVTDDLLYPVLMSPDLIRRQYDIYGGDRVSVWGRVYALNDSIRNEWVRAGAVDQGAEGGIPRTASFLLADSLIIR